MDQIELGSTNIFVTPVGLGTVKFGRNQQVKYPSHFELPSDTEIQNLLAQTQDLGINLLDTAPAYGSSEERLGKLLGKSRSDWVIMTKVGEEFKNGNSFFDFSRRHTINSVERSLKRLSSDYLDVVMIHSDGNDQQILENGETIDALQNLKKAGKIKAFGMSTKTISGGLQALAVCDAVMVTYNADHTDELPVIQEAERLHKGVLIKKGLSSGHLKKLADTSQDPITHAMEFIFQQQGVTSLVVGTINPKHLKQNVQAVEKALANRKCGEK